VRKQRREQKARWARRARKMGEEERGEGVSEWWLLPPFKI